MIQRHSFSAVIYILKMNSISKLKSSTASRPKTYTLPIRCIISNILPPAPLKYKAGQLQRLVVCDKDDFIQVISYDISKTNDLHIHDTICISNYSFNGVKLIINNKTKIMKSGKMLVDEALLHKASEDLKPTTPPVTPIRLVKQQPLQSLASVMGRIVKDEAPTTVGNKAEDIPIKTITLKQDDDEMELSLWRDFSTTTVCAGQHLLAKSLKVVEFLGVKKLATTTSSSIEICNPPEEALHVTILAFEELPHSSTEQQTISLLCQLDGDATETYIITRELLETMLPTNDTDTDMPLEERLQQQIPGIVSLSVCANNIVRVNSDLQPLDS